jgi:hypothetical protein
VKGTATNNRSNVPKRFASELMYEYVSTIPKAKPTPQAILKNIVLFFDTNFLKTTKEKKDA